MKQILFTGLAICAATSSFGQVVFQDTFNRPDNTIPSTIDADVTGIFSTVFTPTVGNVYISNTNGVIEGSKLSKVSGQNGMAYGAINHSFADAVITSAGTFTVSIQVDSLTSGSADPLDRFAGFGIGYSAAEAAGLLDMNSGGGVRNAYQGVSPFAVNFQGVGDFFVGYNFPTTATGNPYAGAPVIAVLLGRDQDTISLIDNVGGNPIAYGGVLSTTFTFSTLGAGETMNYEVMLNGVSVATGSYLQNNGDNYIAFGARAATDFEMDDFTVAVPEPATATVLGLGFAALLARRKRA